MKAFKANNERVKQLLLVLPKYKDNFFGETSQACGYGEHEGGESKWCVDWDQCCTEGCGCALATEQHQETEETDDELETKKVLMAPLN